MYRVKNGVRQVVDFLKGEPAIMPGEFDLNELPRLLGKDDPVILDIGCNDGSHTLEFLRLFASARVYAFEPDPRALASFRSKVNDARAGLFDLAISDEDGVTEFHVSDGVPPAEWKDLRPAGWDLSGSIRKPKEHLAENPWCEFKETISVRTKRLDTWRREEGVESIDFIWADVQGAEENLIRGGAEALRRTRYFYTEYSDRELYEGQIGLREIRGLLPDFDVLYRFSNDVLLKNRALS
jgi:FkbM family methyltransferase